MRQRQAGFSYPIAMFLVAVMSIVALRGVQVTLTNERRSREAQLLEVGSAYSLAIRSYYQGSSGAGTYPPSLDVLLLDDRTSTMRRHLRKRYRDPLTGSDQWGIIPAPGGGVMGVFSLSEKRPVKKAGFPPTVSVAETATKYQEWQFIYQPH